MSDIYLLALESFFDYLPLYVAYMVPNYYDKRISRVEIVSYVSMLR